NAPAPGAGEPPERPTVGARGPPAGRAAPESPPADRAGLDPAPSLGDAPPATDESDAGIVAARLRRIHRDAPCLESSRDPRTGVQHHPAVAGADRLAGSLRRLARRGRASAPGRRRAAV